MLNAKLAGAMDKAEKMELGILKGKLTREILVHATGPMLAAGMSESAVVRTVESVASNFIDRSMNEFAEMDGVK